MRLDKPEGPGGLYLLTGPTAVGKTQLALEWALAHDAEIVSCDALLFYRGADIGTAKPTPEEQAQVVHHGLDLVDPGEVFDIGRYAHWAQACVQEIFSRGKQVLVTGGSGFYLKSFFQTLVDPLEVGAAVRERVETCWQSAGLAGLTGALQACNPGVPLEAYVDLNNPRRVRAALQRCWAWGDTLPAVRARFEALPKPFAGCTKKLWILEREDADLKKRIAARVDTMLSQGLVQEVESLLERGLLKNPTLSRAIGYREPLAFLRGELSKGELAPALVHNTWRLVKKQRTWMRTQLKPDQILSLSPET